MKIPNSAAPDIQQAFRDLSAMLATIAGPGNADFHGRRIINAGAAINDQDYMTKADVRSLITTSTSVTPTGGGQQQTPAFFNDTHANRANHPAAGLPVGSLYYENDRFALYAVALVSGAKAWILLTASDVGSYGARPSDLGANEEGFVFYAQDTGIVLFWSGAAWHWETGTMFDVFSNRPTAGGSAPAMGGGVMFSATDRGFQTWEYDLANARWQFCGGGTPTSGAISGITGSLTAQDAGYLYYATDFDRLYEWNGSAYQDGPGQPTRFQIAYFPQSTVPTGWATCDGGTKTRSTTTGGTASYVAPDLITGNPFIAGGSASGGSGGSATHTHSVDPPNTTSTGPSATTVVAEQIGGNNRNVPDPAHTHDVNVASFTSGSASSLPPYVQEVPMIRL